MEPGPPPDLIFVPGGVGGLLAAVADWTRAHPNFTLAACLSERQRVEGWCVSSRRAPPACRCRHARPADDARRPFDTAMGGLRCGDGVARGFDTVLSARAEAMSRSKTLGLRRHGQLASATSAIRSSRRRGPGRRRWAFAGSFRDPALAGVREQWPWAGQPAMAFVTEGVTDPELFAAVVGRPKGDT